MCGLILSKKIARGRIRMGSRALLGICRRDHVWGLCTIPLSFPRPPRYQTLDKNCVVRVRHHALPWQLFWYHGRHITGITSIIGWCWVRDISHSIVTMKLLSLLCIVAALWHLKQDSEITYFVILVFSLNNDNHSNRWNFINSESHKNDVVVNRNGSVQIISMSLDTISYIILWIPQEACSLAIMGILSSLSSHSP